MKKQKRTKQHVLNESSGNLRREVLSIALLAIGIFYYLCILSYSPLDPSMFSSSGYREVFNLGGVVGAYIAGMVFFLFGGGAYVIGLYFLFNAALVWLHHRQSLRLLDFFIFLVCTTFVSIFLQLQISELTFGDYAINSGGTIGQILGNVGQHYLGQWGVYITVLFGTILTFVVATKLSFVEALNTSTVVLGKGLGSLWGQFLIFKDRLQKLVLGLFARTKSRFEKPAEPQISIHKSKPIDTLDAPEPLAEPELPRKKLSDVLRDPEDKEPKISERRDTEKAKKKKSYSQMELQNLSSGYQLPPLELLESGDEEQIPVDKESLKMSAVMLESKLKDFGIEGRVSEIHPGPVVTMYEFQPAPGVKLSRINNLTDDLSLAMGGRPVRIVAPLPNKAAIGIEIPNHTRETVWLREILSDESFYKSESKMVFALGKDTEGVTYTTDLQKMPHLLVAGSTGSGKSVSINTMICSMLYKARPDEVRMIMIDPKMIELSIYQDIPHLMLPVVTDPHKANLSLKWCVKEMERRYKLLSDVNARNIVNYNKKIQTGDYEKKQKDIEVTEEAIEHTGPLPWIVVVIDEFADLMMVASKEVEESVCRLAQKARAAGIHVILATQRPSVDVITGIIKANFPSRMAFRVTSRHDSRTILDTNGAESLLGMGDMIFMPPGTSKRLRLHGAFVSEEEIARVVDFLKKQAKPQYQEEIIAEPEETIGMSEEDFDEYYDQAVRAVCESKRVSISGIQRLYRIGYNRAARIVEQMESQGVVSRPNSQGQREVLVDAV